MLCQMCNKDFDRKHFNQKYCSDECKKEAIKISKQKYKKTAKGKEAERRYLNSDTGKAKENRYRSSEKAMELARQRAKKFYDKNKDNEDFLERKRKTDREYVLNNYERFREINREASRKYRKTDKGKATNKKQKFMRRSLTPISQETILKIEKENHCYYCGEEIVGKKTIDHKTPVTRGGTNEESNLCVACVHCNTQKNNKTEHEYKEWLKKRENSM